MIESYIIRSKRNTYKYYVSMYGKFSYNFPYNAASRY